MARNARATGPPGRPIAADFAQGLRRPTSRCNSVASVSHAHSDAGKAHNNLRVIDGSSKTPWPPRSARCAAHTHPRAVLTGS
eukprot:531262-Alexandrium_andersonii.AAC.1